ncbi:MAG: FAD-dependent oxidoreductase [Pseudomonadota bacterium]
MHAPSKTPHSFEFSVSVIVIGGGGCGLAAALAASDGGAEVLVLERDPKLWGTTSMSTGLIPAAGTPEQDAAGIEDDPQRFAADIVRKTKGETDEAIVLRLAEQSADTVSWLRDSHHVNLSLLTDFLYPGHSAKRMYGMPNRSGAELMAAMEEAVNAAGVSVLTDATVTRLVSKGDRITGVVYTRPDGSEEAVGCEAVILACCGFAGNAEMVARFMPELENATFHGHPGNKGDAVRWAEELGVALEDMHAYQGHGGLAAGRGIPILWPLIMEGGYQVNRDGKRFADESAGYSEHAVKVIAQPEHVAWAIFDQQRYDLMMKFDDFQQAVSAGAIKSANTLEALAEGSGLDVAALLATNAEVDALRAREGVDAWSRDFTGTTPLNAPFYAAKVTGALFHTQGGIVVDRDARALKSDGTPMPNLYAGGGAARGISGPGADGYMAGNGLLTATTFGKLAGRHAASTLQDKAREIEAS